MDYNDKLHIVLKSIVKHDFIIISYHELNESVKGKVDENVSEYAEKLVELGYIVKDSIARDGGGIIQGYRALELGKEFISNGGFIRQKWIKTGKLILTIIAIIGTISGIRQCQLQEEQSVSNQNKVESYYKSASSTIN